MTADSNSSSTIITNQSGGADLNAGRDLTIGGDVVGRDKIVSNTYTGDQQYDVHGLANPYLGLQSFTYADHAKYAGREKLIIETVTRLTTPDETLALLFVTGASGSGKSSFVQAGVLPALEKHYAALSVKWAVFRPSRDPLAVLADALWRQLGLPQYDASADFGDFLKTHTPAQQINVIVIDQFEELFTQSNAQPRDALFNLLTQLPSFRATHTHIIATVRADYLPELFALPMLYDIAKRGIDLRAMSVDELREAIQQPLRATYPDKDKRFQAELVEQLAHDSAEDAAYLPLLQVTLEEIWRKGTLTVGSYTNLADAIKQRADKVLAYQDYDAAQPDQPRTPEEQAAILNLCLDLVDVSLNDEVRRDVRRRRSKNELISGAPELAQLIDALAQARLLSVGTDSGEHSRVEVDLIHETLLSNWGRLRQAIAERRHELRQRVRFEQQLKEWIGQNRSDDYLLSGVRLAEARELDRRDDVALHNTDAKNFVRFSIEREDARRQKELTDVRRRVVVFFAVAIVALIAAGIAFFFGDQSNKNAATADRNAVDARRNAATAQAASTLAVSSANSAQAASTLAVSEANKRATAQSNALAERDETRRHARVAFLVTQSLIHQNDQRELALLLAIEAERAKDTFEARYSLLSGLAQNSRIVSFMHITSGSVSRAATSMYSRTVALLQSDDSISIWRVTSRQQLVESINGSSFGDLSDIVLSPDGEILAINNGNEIILLHVATRQQLGKALDAKNVTGLAFSLDSKRLVATDDNGLVYLWDVATQQQIGKPNAYVTEKIHSIAFGPDNRTVAVSDDKGIITLWDMSKNQQIGPPLIGHTLPINSLAFSPDGATLASGSDDKAVTLWDLATQQSQTQASDPLIGHSDRVLSVAFSPDGKTLLSYSADGTLIEWHVADDQRLGESLSGHTASVNSVTFSPNGKMLASGGDDETIILWDAATRQQIGRSLVGHSARVTSVAFSPNGKILASGSDDGTIILWDTFTGQSIGKLFAESDSPVFSVAFSPDGKTLVSFSSVTIIFWDVSSPQSPKALAVPLTGIDAVHFSLNGKMLATSSDNQTTRLWDISNPQSPKALGVMLTGHTFPAQNVTFSPDGKILASNSWGTVCTIDAGPLPPKFSCDQDSEIHLWDVSNLYAPQLLGAPPAGHTSSISSLVFSPDGKMLVSGNCSKPDNTEGCKQGGIILWDVDPVSWQTRACQIAGRNLTRAEWQQYMGDEPYRKTCAQWPLEPEAPPTP